MPFRGHFHFNSVSIFVLVFYFFEGLPFVGLSLSALFTILVVAGRKQLAALKNIDKNQNSYQYLRAFDTCLKKIISDDAWIGKVMYPTMFLFVISSFLFLSPNANERLDSIMNVPDTYLYHGVHILWVLGVTIVTLTLSYFGERIYVWDFKLLFGRVMKKMNRTLEDMEELID